MPVINLPYHRPVGDFLGIFPELATHLLLQSAGDRVSEKQRQQPTKRDNHDQVRFQQGQEVV